MIKRMILLFTVMSLTACSTVGRVFPDNSNDYQNARSIADLEIPPDLTSGAANDSMSIPGAGNQVSLSSETARVSRWAEIRTLDNDRSLLLIPEELAVAWSGVESALEAGNIEINGKDQTNGTFDVTYKTDEEQGWFSRLAFWRNTSRPYKVSLSAADTNTELYILEMDGEAASGLEAELLLSTIRTQYNAGKAQ